MIRVWLVDDHPVVREGYARLLQQAGGIEVPWQGGTAEEATSALARQPAPDVLVTDLSMPGEGAMAWLPRWCGRGVRVLVFSMHDGQATVQRVIDLGAAGFVSKSAQPHELVQAVRAVHTGERPLSSELQQRWRRDHADDDQRERLALLTDREFALFRLLAQGHAPAECAALLGVSAKTVSNYQSQIRDKLGVNTSAALAHVALRAGVIGARD